MGRYTAESALLFAFLLLGCAADHRERQVAARPPPHDAVTHQDEIAELVGGLAGDREAARRSRERLVEIGSPAVPALLEALQSQDFGTRWGAVNVLGYIRDRRSLTPLVDVALRDPNNHVRWRSIWAISQMSDETSAAELHSSLRGGDPVVQWNAAVALSALGEPAAVPILLGGLGSTSPWKRWEAVNALGRVHDDGTAAALVPLLQDPDTRIRQEVVLSLGRIATAEAVEALKTALADDHPGVRWRAAMALSQAQAASAASALSAALARETDESARAHMAKALAELSP